MKRGPMSRVVVSTTVLFVMMGMLISGMRIAQMAHFENEIEAAPMSAPREAERIWTNEFALKSLKLETFKPRCQRLRLKRKKRQFHRSRTLKIRRRRFQQKSLRRGCETIENAECFRRLGCRVLNALRVPLAFQRAYDMLEARTPLELMRAHALHTFASLCEVWLLRFLQHVARTHVHSRSSIRNRHMLCPTPGTCKGCELKLIEHNSSANTSCINSKCNDAVEPPGISISSPANIAVDADALLFLRVFHMHLRSKLEMHQLQPSVEKSCATLNRFRRIQRAHLSTALWMQKLLFFLVFHTHLRSKLERHQPQRSVEKSYAILNLFQISHTLLPSMRAARRATP